MYIADTLEKKQNDENNDDKYIDRFLFIKTEAEMQTPDEQETYKFMVSRHASHTHSLTPKLFHSIKCPLDHHLPLKGGGYLTLRRMILNIKVEDSKNALFGTPLFHNVDFVNDSSKLWLGNRPGPGGACHVFTYYEPCAGEAQTMIRGIGKYLGKMYGKVAATSAMDIDYWKGVKGWQYSRSTKKFITPENRQRKANLAHDKNS